MNRTERLLRLARLRGDRAAVAIIETRREPQCADCAEGPHALMGRTHPYQPATESELRALWGDR